MRGDFLGQLRYDKLDNSRMWMICSFFVIIVTCLVYSIVFFCYDNCFYVAEARDILSNGLVTFTDNLSLHDGLPFMHQRILSNFIVYAIDIFGGTKGFAIACFCVNFVFYSGIYLFLRKQDLFENSKFSFFVISIVCMGSYLFVELRASTFTMFILFLVWYLTELYIDHKIGSVRYCLFSFGLGCIEMWIQSSMWFLMVVILLPYLFDFRFARRWIRDRSAVYSKGIISLGSVCMFVGGIFNPYGLKSYDYMVRCLLVPFRCVYQKYVPEMLSGEFDIISVAIISLVLMNLYLMIHYRFFVLRSVYYCAGSTVLLFLSERLKYIAIIFLLLSICIIFHCVKLRQDELLVADKAVFLGHKDSIMCLLLILCVFLFTVVPRTLDFFFVNGRKEYDYDVAIDAIDEHNDKEGLRIFTFADAGSYAEYKGMHSYIDNRSEFFDSNFYEYKKNIIEEFQSLFDDGMYNGRAFADDPDLIYEFQNDYDIDYYVFSSYYINSSDDIYNIADVLNDKAVLNYAYKDICVYSFKDNSVFSD